MAVMLKCPTCGTTETADEEDVGTAKCPHCDDVLVKPKYKAKIQIKVERPEWPIRVQCDVHPWMGGYWISAETPYVALTDANGTFKIGDLPPGDYEVEIWQEKLGKKTEKVSIKAKEETKVDWKLSKS